MTRACFFCKPNNQYVCEDEHCGKCGIDAELDKLKDKPSERMMNGHQDGSHKSADSE